MGYSFEALIKYSWNNEWTPMTVVADENQLLLNVRVPFHFRVPK